MDSIIRPGCLRLLEFENEIVLVVKYKLFQNNLDFLDFRVLRLLKLEINLGVNRNFLGKFRPGCLIKEIEYLLNQIQ